MADLLYDKELLRGCSLQVHHRSKKASLRTLFGFATLHESWTTTEQASANFAVQKHVTCFA